MSSANRIREIPYNYTSYSNREIVIRLMPTLRLRCPACQQGLSRYEKKTGMATDYIVVELARLLYGENWQQHFTEQITRGGMEKVLL